MLQLILNKKILATSLLLASSFIFANDIGDITEHKGSGGISRECDTIITALGLGVEQLDKIETAYTDANLDQTGDPVSLVPGNFYTKHAYDKITFTEFTEEKIYDTIG